MKQLATVSSYIFHPVFIPSIAFLLFFLLPVADFSTLTWAAINKWFAIIVINSCFFPLLLVVLLKRLDFINILDNVFINYTLIYEFSFNTLSPLIH